MDQQHFDRLTAAFVCGAAGFNLINQEIPGFANLCGADFNCQVKTCPTKVTA